MEEPNAGWITEALEEVAQKHGVPKHTISDQAPVFSGGAPAKLLIQWNIIPRLGAVGEHGSIAVTERVIKTLKYKWLKRVPLIKEFNHLMALCTTFERWHNAWRPHMTLKTFGPMTYTATASPRCQSVMQEQSPATADVTCSPKHGSQSTASRSSVGHPV